MHRCLPLTWNWLNCEDAQRGEGWRSVSQTLMLDDRINELRHDPTYAHSFPADPPKVAKTDMAKLKENFDAIAGGTVVVE